MKQLTIRNLPPEIERAIRRRAQAEKTSLNRAVVALLEEAEGSRKKRPSHHDYDKFAGRWTKKDAQKFERALAQQRKIDPELWK
ncbi:MAG: hypothetical protein AB1405_07120 [Bdellovibrionota bacterium]